jgi:membrane-bound lytic murein transglycosylase A
MATLKLYLRWPTLAALFFLLVGCAVQQAPAAARPLILLKSADYPLFHDDMNFEQLTAGIESSLNYYRRLPPDRTVAFGADNFSVDHLIGSLTAFGRLIADRPDAELLNRSIRENYLVYRAAGRDDGKMLFTGYFEPLLPGSPVRTPEFPVAVHSRPADLVDIDLTAFDNDLKGRRLTGRLKNGTVVPYPDRTQIRKEPGFNQTAPPIAWLRDEIDLTVLQIQGSGRILFGDGRMLRVRFNGSNGRPYRSIGSLLVAQGRISAEALSLQTIRDYLRNNPLEREAILDYNPRYIFFKTAETGPVGFLNELLTPTRSIAVDQNLFPAGALAFAQLPVPLVDPQGAIAQWRPFSGFVLAQDAGGAIQGPGRVDLFWGAGPEAEVAAGHLKHPGDLYFIVLKPRSNNG